MIQRINYAEQSLELLQKFTEFLPAARESSIEEPIGDLVAIRAAQLNGCAFCLGMCVKQAEIHGEREFAPLTPCRMAGFGCAGVDGSSHQDSGARGSRRTQLSEREISHLSFNKPELS